VVDLNNSTLHHVIIDTVLERGCAPTAAELAQRFQRPRDEVDTAVHEFAQDHGVILHPGSDEIWVVHPFSMAPTGFVVRAGDREWWGNCALCSLGVVALAGGPLPEFALGTKRQIFTTRRRARERPWALVE
jgi:hypothetical protein